jgi:hypothetical protein
MKEEFIKKMNEMDFSPRFLRSIPFFRNDWIFRVHNSTVNAEINFSERVEKTKSYFYGCGGYYLPHFRRYDVNFIYSNGIFEIYSKRYKDKRSLPTYLKKRPVPIGKIVHNKRILASFPYDYESVPIEINTKINLDGQEQEIFFLSFLNEKETLAVVCEQGRPKAFTGLPFAVASALGNEVILQGGHKATLSIEMPEDIIRGGLVFSF